MDKKTEQPSKGQLLATTEELIEMLSKLSSSPTGSGALSPVDMRYISGRLKQLQRENQSLRDLLGEAEQVLEEVKVHHEWTARNRGDYGETSTPLSKKTEKVLTKIREHKEKK